MSATDTKRPGILIVDDEEQIRSLLCSMLEADYDCVTVGSAEEAINLLKVIKFELVISDINMGALSGLELVPYIVKETPETVVVMITGQDTIDAAIKPMRAG